MVGSVAWVTRLKKNKKQPSLLFGFAILSRGKKVLEYKGKTGKTARCSRNRKHSKILASALHGVTRGPQAVPCLVPHVSENLAVYDDTWHEATKPSPRAGLPGVPKARDRGGPGQPLGVPDLPTASISDTASWPRPSDC